MNVEKVRNLEVMKEIKKALKIITGGILTGAKYLTEYIDVIIFIIIMYFKSYKFNPMISLYHNRIFELSCLGSVLILAGLSLLIKRKVRMPLLLATDIVISALFISDFMYFRYYNDVISAPVILQIGLVDSALKGSIMNLFNVRDLVFLADVPVFLSVMIYIYIKGFRFKPYRIISRAVSTVLVLTIGIYLVHSGFTSLNRMMGNKSLTMIYDHSFFIGNVGILNYHGFDAFYFLSNKFIGQEKLSAEEKEKIKSVFAQKTQNDNVKKLNGVGQKLNLIMIQVEAMQNIVINMKVGGREVTPNLNRFIKKSMYFNNFYSQIGQGNTADAEFVANNSFYALSEGCVYFRYTNNAYDALPEVLKQQGYTTMAMHAYKASFWNRATIYPKMGFDMFYSKKDYVQDEIVGGWGLTDKSFFRQSLEKLKNASQPFYSFLITLTSHYPYEGFGDNGPYRYRFDAGQYNGTFFGTYLKAMNYVDESLGYMLDNLQKSGLMDNSIIVIYGDHEGVKRNDLEKISQYIKMPENNDVAFLKMIKVPLFIHLPQDQNAGIKNIAGGQIDLFPTLANLLGLKPSYYMGRDLLNIDRGYAILRDGSVTDGKYVYLKKYNEAYEIETGKKIDNSKFSDLVEFAMEQLRLSDTVIKSNLLSQFSKEQEGG